ncbi:hypothetical protein V8F06_006912 [Rhypophila decipiens]
MRSLQKDRPDEDFSVSSYRHGGGRMGRNNAFRFLTKYLQARLPPSDQDDRLAISLTSKAANQAVDLAIRTHPQDWTRIGGPGVVRALFNKTSNLAWIVPCEFEIVDGRRRRVCYSYWKHDFFNFSYHGFAGCEEPLYQSGLQRFAGIRKVAFDLWPHLDLIRIYPMGYVQNLNPLHNRLRFNGPTRDPWSLSFLLKHFPFP